MTAIEAATHWFTALLTGPLVTSLLIVAVAAFGIGLLLGRLSLRRGMEVVVGCFVLAGAAEISGAMMDRAPVAAIPALPSVSASLDEKPLAPLGPDPVPIAAYGNPFDPYAGGKPID
jgi:TrbC/VIRB2 pilin